MSEKVLSCFCTDLVILIVLTDVVDQPNSYLNDAPVCTLHSYQGVFSAIENLLTRARNLTPDIGLSISRQQFGLMDLSDQKTFMHSELR